MAVGPVVHIIIVTWNSAKFVNEVLMRLKLQTFSPDKILILDNASNDVDLLELIIASNPVEVELVKLDKNIGFAAANNIGINKCKSADFITLLNPDAFPESTWLESLVCAANKYPDYAFFSSRQMQLTKGVVDGAGDEMPFWGKPYRRGYGKLFSKRYLTDKRVFSACAAAAMYRQDALTVAGGFDEDFFCYVEDVDLSFRLNLLGFKCMYVAGAVVTHIGSASLGKRSDFAMYHGQRNMVTCFFKNVPLPCLIIFLPFHMLCNIFFIFIGIFLGKSTLIFTAKYDAFYSLPKTLKKRNKVQSNRKISILTFLRIIKYGLMKD